MKHTTLIIILILSKLITLNAQDEWIVPDDKKSKLSPFEFTDSTRNAGSEIFMANCKSCHGEPGKNNYVPLIPPPGDPASPKFQANTDGDIYYKVRTGRVTMPSFSNRLTPNDVWNVISYIRSYNSNYVQEIAKEIQRSAYNGEISISIAYLKDKNLIETKVIGTKENESEPIAGAKVRLFVKRLFGNLQLDEEKITDKEGIALFATESSIPGDAEGNIKLLAQLSDQEAFGLVEEEAFLPLGKVTNAPALNAQRAMWNKMRKAPVWLLLCYSILVIAAWTTIFFVLFQLKKIFELGKNN